MKKNLFILLIGSVFILSACNSNISQSKQGLDKKTIDENSNTIDKCVQQCSQQKKEQKVNSIDCSNICLINSEPYQRDQRRIMDIKQIQTALQLYFDDAKQYPPELTTGGPISYNGLSYMFATPSAPTPADGLCADNNAYKYRVVNEPQVGQAYTLTYCLGGDTDSSFFGEIKAGLHTATQKGAY